MNKDLALNNLQWLFKATKSKQIVYIQYMYIEDLVLNNLQWLICHKTKPNQSKSYIFNICIKRICH